MSNSEYSNAASRPGEGVNYDPDIPGTRTLGPRDAYDAGDGYTILQPKPFSNSERSSEAQSNAEAGIAQRDRYDRNGSGPPSYDRSDYYRPSDRGRPGSYDDLPRYRDGYDSYSSEDDYDDRQHRRGSDREGRKRRGSSVARLKRKVSGKLLEARASFAGDDDDGEGNTQVKKWGATVAGAVAGGLAARQVKRENWVPAALGAVIGGFSARELEKQYYKSREGRGKEKESWEGRRPRSRSRSRPRD